MIDDAAIYHLITCTTESCDGEILEHRYSRYKSRWNYSFDPLDTGDFDDIFHILPHVFKICYSLLDIIYATCIDVCLACLNLQLHCGSPIARGFIVFGCYNLHEVK